MKTLALTEALRLNAACEFSRAQREAIWESLSDYLPARQSVSAPRQNWLKRAGLAAAVVALGLCFSFASAGLLGGGELLPEDAGVPLSAWEENPVTLEQSRLVVPVGSKLTQEGILAACGAAAAYPGELLVSGLDKVSTEVPGECSVQITLRAPGDIALGSVFLTLVVEEI